MDPCLPGIFLYEIKALDAKKLPGYNFSGQNQSQEGVLFGKIFPFFAMNVLLNKIIEPKNQIREEQKVFSNQALKIMLVPLFMEQLLSVLVGVADTFMVSYAGEAAVSGVSLVNMFNTVFLFLFSALSAGQLVMISALFSLVLMAVILLLNRRLLGLLFGEVEGDVMDACVTYLRISAYSYPAIAIYNAGAAIYRSMGKTNVTMYLSLAANGINVAGNAIGVFLLHAGVAGVAYPSLISRSFSGVVIIILCFKKSNEVYLVWRKILCWKGNMIRKILGIAVPNGIENGLFQLIKVALSSITALFGTVQIAANGVAQSFWSVAALMGTALGLACITVIGQCMGAGDRQAADYYMRKLLRITFLASVVWNGLILLISPLVLQGYALSPQARKLTFVLILIHNIFNALFYPLSGALSNGLRAAGDVKFTMYVSIFSTIFCRVVFSVIFGIWMNLGVIGVAFAMCLDWGLRALLFWIRFKKGKWKEFRVIG